jgi:hypothetical protein
VIKQNYLIGGILLLAVALAVYPNLQLAVVPVGTPYNVSANACYMDVAGWSGYGLCQNYVTTFPARIEFKAIDTTANVLEASQVFTGTGICSGSCWGAGWSFTPTKGHNYHITANASVAGQQAKQYAWDLTLAGCPWCGDGVCHSVETTDAACGGVQPAENENNCYIDCHAPPQPTCGDSMCNGNETCSTCPGDCGTCPTATCGDGICNLDETWQNCPKDCLSGGQTLPIWAILGIVLIAGYLIYKKRR